MEKSKRKLKSKITNPSLKSIEFVSPLQPEQCVELLRQRHDWSLLAALTQRIRVEVAEFDDDLFEFTVERVSGRGTIVKITGDLQRWEGTSTRVSAKSEIGDSMYVFWLILSISIIGIPIAILNYYLVERNRKQLIRIIQRTLGVNND
jgi:hypothetical protein